MEALSGSCLQIPCSFTTKEGEDFDREGTIFGIWIKTDERFATFPQNVIFNSSKSENRYQMNITGNLSERNCTTLFSNLKTSQTDRYFFRIENRPFKATAICHPITITVKDSAWSPRINISGVLKEKESVTITCSAFTPCPHSPPELTWNLQQHSHRQIEENKDGTFISRIQKTITLSDSHDGYNISCSVTYPVDGGKRVKSAQTEVTLSVSYAPKDTSVSISPSGLVSAGSWVNLSCSSRAKPPVSSFTWFQSSKGGAVRVAEGRFYSFNATERGEYYCVASNNLGNQTSQRISLDIKGLGGNVLWEAILVGIIGIICLVVCVCIFMYWRQTNENNSTTQQLQNRTSEDVVAQETDRKAEDNKEEEDGIHYGEIKFSKQTPEPLFKSQQDNRLELDTVYAQVKVSEPPKHSTDTGIPDDLYAQVKLP
ncbi:sialic acid-binding Ig-like lectin 12 isoform 2-T2 [Menidia menidia]